MHLIERTRNQENVFILSWAHSKPILMIKFFPFKLMNVLICFSFCYKLFNCRCLLCRFFLPLQLSLTVRAMSTPFLLLFLYCSPLLKYFSSQKIESFSLFIFFTLYQTLKIRCELRKDYKCDKKKWMEEKCIGRSREGKKMKKTDNI